MLQIVKISADDLEVGMYISRLDRPWLETPFMLQGLVLSSEEEIQLVQQYCQHVYIDTLRSVHKPLTPRPTPLERPRKSVQELFGKRALKKLEDTSNWKEEYPRAVEAVESLSRGIKEIFDNVVLGGALDIVKVKKSVDPMIASVVRNPDACIWLARIKQEDHYTYQHSLGASIWAVALGRQLGLPKADLRSLAIGGLLFDLGKLGIDKELLRVERTLTDDEMQQLRDHVSIGLEMVKGSGLMNQDVIDMVAYHHERHDGSGYPSRHKGDDIPVFARIAAIVDCYDAITSHRSYARAISPSEAIKMLYQLKDIDFQAELIEEFIQAVGIYPAGTLVELSSGEVAVVVAEYRTRRLRPRVMVLLDSEKQQLSDIRTVDLLNVTETDDGEPLDIVNSLESDAYGLDMAGLKV